MSDSYSVLSEDTSAHNPALPICAIPEFEAAGPVSRNAEMWLYRERTVALAAPIPARRSEWRIATDLR